MTELINGTLLPRVPSASEFDAAPSCKHWAVPATQLPLPTTTPTSTRTAATRELGDVEADETSLAAYRTTCKRLLTYLSRAHANQLCATAAAADTTSAAGAFKCRLLESTLFFSEARTTDSDEAADNATASEPGAMEVKTSMTALFPQTVESAPATADSFLFCRAQLFTSKGSAFPAAEAFSILQTYGGVSSRL